VIVDCRFDLANPAKGEELYREATFPRATRISIAICPG
jgi:hypothetical protein